MIARRRSLRPSGKPPRARKKDPAKRRFAKLRNAAFQAWVRQHPCCLPGCLLGYWVVECAHVRTRAAGGDDVGNCVPLCWEHHEQQHTVGIKSFQRIQAVDLKKVAADLAERWAGRAWETR